MVASLLEHRRRWFVLATAVWTATVLVSLSPLTASQDPYPIFRYLHCWSKNYFGNNSTDYGKGIQESTILPAEPPPTGWSCAEWCRIRGYPLSALSLDRECRCGFFWQTTHESHGCGPCPGNNDLNCSLSADSVAVHFALPAWPSLREIGCYLFSEPRPGLEIPLPPLKVDLGLLEPRSCAAACQKRGYPYSGIGGLFDCYCLMTPPTTAMGALCTSVACYAKFVSVIADYVPETYKCGGTDTIALYGHQSGAPDVRTTPSSSLLSVTVGDALPNFTCRGTVNSLWALLRLSWVKDGAVGNNKELLTPVTAVGNVSQDYSIGRVSGKDNGDYSCFVESLGESVLENKRNFNLVRLRVYTLPNVSISNTVVATERAFTLSCEAQGNGTLKYSWPQSNGGTIDATGQLLSFVNATKAMASTPFECHVNVEETNRTVSRTVDLLVLDRPIANVVPQQTVAALGDDVELTCEASGDEPIVFTWLGPGNRVNQGATWRITNVTESHGGLYTCSATNTLISDRSVAMSRKTGALTVEANPPRASASIRATSGQVHRDSRKPTSYVLLPQTSVKLNCSAMGNAARMEISWYRLFPQRRLISNTSILSLDNVTDSQGNTYVCQALDPGITTAGRLHEVLLDINVFVSPQVTFASERSVHVVGDRVEISCQFKGDTPDNFTWTKDGQVVSSLQMARFLPISKDDTGVYSCEVSGKPADDLPQYSHKGNVSLIVQAPPQAMVPSSEVNFLPGSNLTLECLVSGEGSVTPSWLLGDVVIRQSGRLHLNRTGNKLILTIVDATQEDAGVYTCRADDPKLVDPNRRVHSIEVSALIKEARKTSSSDDVTLPLAIVCAVIGIILIIIVVIIVLRQRRENSKKGKQSSRGEEANGTSRPRSSDAPTAPTVVYSNFIDSTDGDSSPVGRVSLVSIPSRSTCASQLSPQISSSSHKPPTPQSLPTPQKPATPPQLNPTVHDYCSSGPRPPSQEIAATCHIYDYAYIKANSWNAPSKFLGQEPKDNVQGPQDNIQELLAHYDHVKSAGVVRHSCPPDPSNTYERVQSQQSIATVTSAEVLAAIQGRMNDSDFGSDEDEEQYQDPSRRKSFQLTDIPCAGLPSYGRLPSTAQSLPATTVDFMYAKPDKPDKERKAFPPRGNVYDMPSVRQLPVCRTLSDPYEVPQLPPRTFQDDRDSILKYSSANNLYSDKQLPSYTHLSHNFDDDANAMEPYEEPPNSPQSIYSKLNDRRYKHILPDQIQLGEQLAKGRFGDVLHAKWKQGDCIYDVAVKQLHPDTEEQDRIRFLQEGIVMGQFLHPNIVRLHGVITEGEPTMLVLEMMEKGCLELILPLMMPADLAKPRRQLKSLLLNMMRDVACGMDYLAKRGFIHRDLAARSIFVDAQNVCKIGAFGMSRDLADNDYYISSSGVIIPVRWTAPEAIDYHCYSTASDMWSFGVLLYEIWSFGRTPYGMWSNEKVRSKVLSGYRMPAPVHCPSSISQIMQLCWMTDPKKRPTFSEIIMILSVKDVCLLSS